MPIRSRFISRGSNNYLLYPGLSQENGMIYRSQSAISFSQFQRYGEKSPRATFVAYFFPFSTPR